MKKLFILFFLVFFPFNCLAQEVDKALFSTGESGVNKRGWVLLDESKYVKGEMGIKLSSEALGGRSYSYVAFYADGVLIALDETPPFSVTYDFGSYTRKAKIVAIGVQYELTASAIEAVAGPVSEQAAFSAGSIRFTSPAKDEYCYGMKQITADVEATGGAVQRVDFAVDGNFIESDSEQPYGVEYNFGRGFDPHLIKAVAILADGRRLESEMRTAPLENSDYFIRTRLVTLDATVVDWRDRLVSDLKADEFRVFEDGVEQNVSHFSIEERPLRVALLIDISESMSRYGKIEKAKESAKRFLDYLKPDQDKAALIAFTHEVNVLSGFTNDFQSLKNKISKLEPVGGTAIHDALARVAPMFDEEAGRKAIILISDGYDEHSEATVGEAVEEVKRSGLKVYSIAILEQFLMLENAIAAPDTQRGKVPDLDPEDARKGDRPLDNETDPRRILFIGLADETGGTSFFPKRLDDLPLAFERIAEELRVQYSIGYVPTNAQFDGSWRKIGVKTTRGGLTVRTKQGYYAESKQP
jgi:Ca-activated chloride channel family protein